ncbi:glycosyl transferase, partial [Ochrobactrum sp. GRS2]|nr:glycosyl transferase [Ochrobactrum sp. GRS2]
MLNEQSFPVYALNLDRSKDRWDSLLAHAQEVGVAVQRVPAVDGKLLRPEDKKNFDDAGFRRDHGKIASVA